MPKYFEKLRNHQKHFELSDPGIPLLRTPLLELEDDAIIETSLTVLRKSSVIDDFNFPHKVGLRIKNPELPSQCNEATKGSRDVINLNKGKIYSNFGYLQKNFTQSQAGSK